MIEEEYADVMKRVKGEDKVIPFLPLNHNQANDNKFELRNLNNLFHYFILGFILDRE